MKVEIEQQNQEPMDFEEMVQKTVNAKAKVGLWSSTMIQDSDARCLRDYCPSNSTVSKI